MARYAEGTSVAADRSRAEIERTLQRYGATSFAYGWDDTAAMIGFVIRGLQISMRLTMPDRADRTFTRTTTGRDRSEAAAYEAWEQSCRQRWRSLALVIKAKLEAVESGITTLESEFLAHTVLPSGLTVEQQLGPGIAASIAAGSPAMIPALESGA